MAKPIKETPVLRGKDAVRFMREIAQNENKKASKKEIEEINNSFNRIMALAR